MVTASHNPKAYTGVKLRPRGRAGALRRRRDRRRPRARSRPASADAARRRLASRRSTSGTSSASTCSPSSTRTTVEPAEGRRRRRQRDGRPDGRADPRAARPRARRRCYFEPDGEFPDHEPNPLLRGEPAADHRAGAQRAAPTSAIAWDGDADRCFFIDGERRVLRRRLRLRAARPRGAGEGARRDDPLRPALEPRRPRHGRAPRAGAPTLSRVGHAFFKARMREDGRRLRRRGLRPLLLPRLLVRRLGHDPGAAHARAALARGPHARRADGRVPLASYFISGEINSEVADQEAKMERDRRALLRRRDHAASTASRSTTRTGTSTCAPPTPSRCCASTSSRWSPARTWRPKRDEVLGLIRA